MNGDRPQLHKKAPRGGLTEPELQTIAALVEVLIPGNDMPGASTEWVRTHVEARTRNDAGYLPEYRSAVVLLDGLAAERAGGRFHELPVPQRDALLFEHFDRDGFFDRVRFRLGLATEGGDLKNRCWHYVIRDLLAGFYRSPAGWAVVGYTSYPGVPGDPRGYTRAPRPIAAH